MACRLWPSRSPDVGHLERQVEHSRTEVVFDTKGQTAESIFDKLTVAQKVGSLPTKYGDGKCVTVFTKARRRSIF